MFFLYIKAFFRHALAVSTGKIPTDLAAVIAWCDSHDTVKDFRIIAGTGKTNL